MEWAGTTTGTGLCGRHHLLGEGGGDNDGEVCISGGGRAKGQCGESAGALVQAMVPPACPNGAHSRHFYGVCAHPPVLPSPYALPLLGGRPHCSHGQSPSLPFLSWLAHASQGNDRFNNPHHSSTPIHKRDGERESPFDKQIGFGCRLVF